MKLWPHRFRDPEDPFQVAIVRDMWLTGFDAPNLHTMYVDKPMRGHGLMQTIARVNRVFKDKPGGLIVDYLGIAQELKQAVTTYTASGGTGETAIDQAKAVEVMQEKYDVCRGLFYGFDYSDWTGGSPAQRLSLLPAALEHVLAPRKWQGSLPGKQCGNFPKHSHWQCRTRRLFSSETTSRSSKQSAPNW